MGKHILWTYLILLLFTSCSNDSDQPSSGTSEPELPVMDVSFGNEMVGGFENKDVKRLFPNVVWVETHGRSEIVQDEERGKVLRVKYPKGSVGPKQGGIEFITTLPGSNEYYLDFYVKFDSNFDFKEGGKLLGLASDNGIFTGGRIPTEKEGGWSARCVWSSQGKPASLYLYYVDMETEWGEGTYLNTGFEKDKWYRITQHVRLNDIGKKNASVTIWVNEQLAIEKKNFRLRSGSKGAIDTFCFSTFHGGNTAEWAPGNDSYIFFDSFRITKQRPF